MWQILNEASRILACSVTQHVLVEAQIAVAAPIAVMVVPVAVASEGRRGERPRVDALRRAAAPPPPAAGCAEPTRNRTKCK